MEALIPLEYYTTVYYYILLVVCLFMYLSSATVGLENDNNLKNKNILGVAMVIFTIVYIGLRPVSGAYFGDMRTYSDAFERYAAGDMVDVSAAAKDMYFEYFMKACSTVMSQEAFFFVCAAIYVIPLYFVCRKFFRQFWFYGFAMLIFSFSFWSYGTNGIRNGMATSLFLLAISRESRIWTYAIFGLTLMIHKSMLIPIGAFTVASYYTNTRNYLIAWAIAIPVSFALGSALENFFLTLGLFDDSRLQEYLGDEDSVEATFKTGFRWDFLLYSSVGIFCGWYFLVKKKLEDTFYRHLFHTYLIANTFWILVIRANFSNRFAYLSWFMLGLVVIYPFLKNRFFDNQHIIVGRIAFAYYAFTFFMAIYIYS
ncbi:EpsG family protein [Flavobacterium sp.]|uniref:EpsG family protein n=1 Tax=Flavobacterium sp. TaxID=239 RepID=UPI00120FEE70|nr:EpsG family protein [Flavobacterium sp.]RZJ70840.1 MAG: EpsG family protein [Flavobacterium sp.]